MQFSRKFMMVSVIVVIAAVLLWTFAGTNKSDSENADPGASQKGSSKQAEAMDSLNENIGGKESPILVEAAPVSRGSLIKTVSAQGRVFTYGEMDIINEVSGKLAKIHVRDGQKVKKGQLIAEIDQQEYQLDVLEAESKYLKAQADFVAFDQNMRLEHKTKEENQDKLAELASRLKKGLISTSDYEREKLALELAMVGSGEKKVDVIKSTTITPAKIALDRARLKLDKCIIAAPFDGVVFGLEVSIGEYLNASTKIAKLVSLQNLVVKANILESEIGQITENRPVKIKFTALPGLGQIEGSVLAVSPMVNEEDKTVETILNIDGSAPGIRPGMFVEVVIDSQIYENRLMVPKMAILPRDDRKVVFKVSEDNRAKWIYVETGVENDQFVEIVKGTLNPGDMVLIDNHFTMGHDTLVEITN